MPEDIGIVISLNFPSGVCLKDCASDSPADRNVLSIAMNGELEAFNAYIKSTGLGPLVPMERSLIKTYIAWKLLYEKKTV